MEKIDYLIETLLKERNEKMELKPLSLQDKKILFRSLCNTRNAIAISEEYLKVQDIYLQEELLEKGIVDNIDEHKIANNIYLWKGDITTLKVDAIVNAANSRGLGCFIPCHKCIDNAIHSASGIQLRLACNEKMKEMEKLETGKSFMTSGYNLPSKYVIHTVGPIIYDEVTNKEIQELKESYISCLDIARQNNIRTIAFPCISTGEFRFPKELASNIAIETVITYLSQYKNTFDKVVFNVFTKDDYEIYENKLRNEMR